MFLQPYRVDDEIALRLLVPDDAELSYHLIDANRDHIGQWEEWAHYVTLDEQRAFIEAGVQRYLDGLGFNAGIWYRAGSTGNPTLVGTFSTQTAAHMPSTEFAYWLAKDYTGRGIVTRVARVVIEYLFSIGQQRIVIVTAAENTPSRAVAERLGFSLDGVLRHDRTLHGSFIDRAYYTLLVTAGRSHYNLST